MSEILVTPQSADITIGIEATRLLLRVVVLKAGVISERYQIPLDYSDSLAARLAAAINEVKQKNDVQTIGIAVSGLVNRLTNRVVLSTQIPDLVMTDLAAELSAQIGGTPIHLENDANAAAYGEYLLGAGRGSRSLFYATIGAGIGGSLVLNGQIWRGANGFAGEFGHIAINEDGVKLEDVASATNIVRRTRERLLQDSTSSLSRELIEKAATVANIVAAANNGDDFAQLMLERTGAYIGTAIASVINLLNVETVVLGGEVMEAGGVVLQSIARKTRERSFLPSFEATKIAAAELGADAPAIGAALLANNAAAS